MVLEIGYCMGHDQLSLFLSVASMHEALQSYSHQPRCSSLCSSFCSNTMRLLLYQIAETIGSILFGE
jgi:hypothetical protein